MTAAISVGTGLAIAGTATVAGAVISSNASRSAANAQARAAQQSTDTQLQMYNQTRADQAPWRAAGGEAVNALAQFEGLPGVNPDGTPRSGNTSRPDFNKILSGLPGYQFQLDQGSQAIDRNLAARGLLQSGAAGKALTQYGQGLAQDYSQQYVGGLQSLAGLGIQSNAQTTAAGINAGNQISGNQIYAGNARASGYVGQANAIGQGLSGLAGIYGNYQAGQQLQQQQQYDNLQPFYPQIPRLPEPTNPYFGGP